MVLRKFQILPIEKIGTISHYTEIVCMFMYSNQFVCFAKTLICNSKILDICLKVPNLSLNARCVSECPINPKNTQLDISHYPPPQ